jgi:nucleotide-binding universal stress UspA family protein
MLTQDVQQTAPRAPAEGHGGVQRVLVAFDGSEGAWAALQQAIAVAVSNRALLTIAGVVQEPRFVWAGPGAMAVPYTREGMRKELELEMRRLLAGARDEVPATVSVTTRILYGRPARALAALAQEGGFDLVVTGPRPVGRLGRLLRGSVTHSLLSRTRISVLAVRVH